MTSDNSTRMNTNSNFEDSIKKKNKKRGLSVINIRKGISYNDMVKKRKKSLSHKKVTGGTSYATDTPHRFMQIIKNEIYSCGSQRLMDMTAINILKAHGIGHILFVSPRPFPLPRWWNDTGISFRRFDVNEESGLPNVDQVREIMTYVDKILNVNNETKKGKEKVIDANEINYNSDNSTKYDSHEGILIANYSKSDSEYCVHIISSLLYAKYTLGVNLNDTHEKMMNLLSIGRSKPWNRIYKEGVTYPSKISSTIDNSNSVKKTSYIDSNRRLKQCFEKIFPERL